MRLNGRVAVVTGAGRGLGEAIALRFAAEGAAVALNDMDATTAAATVAQIEKQGGRATAVIGSVTDEANVQALIERAVQAFGGVDILVNNAGITRDKLLKDMSVDDWDAVLNLNLRATFLCCKHATPLMVSKGWGRVINMSSRAHLGNKGQVNYSASKAGVIGLTRSLSMELGKFGVTANCIAPGIIATPGVTVAAALRSPGRARRADPSDPAPRQAGRRRRRRRVPRQRRRGVHHRRNDPRVGRAVRLSSGRALKTKDKRQKTKDKSVQSAAPIAPTRHSPFAFCLVPFVFCLRLFRLHVAPAIRRNDLSRTKLGLLRDEVGARRRRCRRARRCGGPARRRWRVARISGETIAPATIGVSIRPGATVLTVIPAGPSSCASALLKAMMPPLAAE